MDDFIHGCHTGGRATGTIDDFIHGRQGALWMTSSMDATEGGKKKALQIVLVQLESLDLVDLETHQHMAKQRSLLNLFITCFSSCWILLVRNGTSNWLGTQFLHPTAPLGSDSPVLNKLWQIQASVLAVAVTGCSCRCNGATAASNSIFSVAAGSLAKSLVKALRLSLYHDTVVTVTELWVKRPGDKGWHVAPWRTSKKDCWVVWSKAAACHRADSGWVWAEAWAWSESSCVPLLHLLWEEQWQAWGPWIFSGLLALQCSLLFQFW
jgi:hypothetical protein